MAILSQLTETEFKELLDEYFAEPQQRSKLTQEEVKALAVKLNTKINVPIINETKEEKILIKIIVKVDTFLYSNLPNEFYNLVRNMDDGIDDDEAKRLIKRLAKLANKHIDIPYVPEQFENVGIRFVIAVIINSARKNWNFLKATEESDNLKIPSNENASDGDLECMIPA